MRTLFLIGGTVGQFILILFIFSHIVDLISILFHAILKMSSDKSSEEKIRWIGALRLTNHQERLAEISALLYVGDWRGGMKDIASYSVRLGGFVGGYVLLMFLGGSADVGLLIWASLVSLLCSVYVVELRWGEIEDTLQVRSEKHIMETGNNVVENKNNS